MGRFMVWEFVGNKRLDIEGKQYEPQYVFVIQSS